MKNLLNVVKRNMGRTGLVIEKYSPELWMAAGILSGIGTIVLASRAALKAEEVIDQHKEMMDQIKKAEALTAIEAQEGEENELSVSYSKEDIAQDKIRVYSKTVVGFAKLYSPVVAAGALTLTCFLVSNHILKKRYLGAVAAYNAVSAAFERYRAQVRDEVGEDADYRFSHGIRKVTVTKEVEGEKGKKKVVKEEVEVIDDLPSQYARFFDSSNENWDENAEFSLMFLKAQETMANHILHSRGHIFLNEVYDMLGFERTSEGQVAGWVEGDGDDYVDFGLADAYREGVRRFVNGQENAVLLDFNVDGVIWDKI